MRLTEVLFYTQQTIGTGDWHLEGELQVYFMHFIEGLADNNK